VNYEDHSWFFIGTGNGAGTNFISYGCECGARAECGIIEPNDSLGCRVREKDGEWIKLERPMRFMLRRKHCKSLDSQ
jgi:hypothetical protein